MVAKAEAAADFARGAGKVSMVRMRTKATVTTEAG